MEFTRYVHIEKLFSIVGSILGCSGLSSLSNSDDGEIVSGGPGTRRFMPRPSPSDYWAKPPCYCALLYFSYFSCGPAWGSENGGFSSPRTVDDVELELFKYSLSETEMALSLLSVP